eukprot:COSAG06_NODE_4985_length_3806_cov_2.019153_4_plen_731_part_01
MRAQLRVWVKRLGLVLLERAPGCRPNMPRANPYPSPLPPRASSSELMGSGRLSILDIVEADLVSNSSATAGRWATAKWVGVALCYSLVSVALWDALRSFYFHGGVLDGEQEVACDSLVASRSRAEMHWVVGTAPAWARNCVVLGLVFTGCRRAGGLSRAPGLAEVVLFGGAGGSDGDAKDAGWLAIVGGTPEGRLQCSWAQARDARRLSDQTARWLAALKLIFWHWSQPVAYLWLLYVYRCLVVQLGLTQQKLAAIVAAREVIYLLSTMVALQFCPVFLMLDLRTVWSEAESWLVGGMRIAMYVLTPHTYTALSLANRFRRWAHAFLCIAVFQVLADISSCYALASLMASSIEVASEVKNSSVVQELCLLQPGEPAELEQACLALDTKAKCVLDPEHCVWASDSEVDTRPLEFGYGLTAFGFLLFFGPLAISSGFQGSLDKERHRLLRLAKGISGTLLLVIWMGITAVLIWLIGGGNPFCPGIPSLEPCNGHGTCYGYSACHCDLGYGPEYKGTGDALCAVPDSPCTADQLDRELSKVGSSNRTDAVCCSGNGRLVGGGCQCNLGYFPELLDDPLRPRARLCASTVEERCEQDRDWGKREAARACCNNHGQHSIQLHSICDCNAGFSGRHCENETDMCLAHDPCGAHSTCQDFQSDDHGSGTSKCTLCRCDEGFGPEPAHGEPGVYSADGGICKLPRATACGVQYTPLDQPWRSVRSGDLDYEDRSIEPRD